MALKDKIGESVLNFILPVAESTSKRYLKLAWSKLNEKNPTALKTTLTSIYPSVDQYLEAIVKESKTEIDDAVVRALKQSIEESAKEFGITLPNVDAD